jgi:molecular chaperone IbpA
MPTILTLDLPTLHRRFIGYDEIFQELERAFQTGGKQDNYPPHNVIKTGENQFQLELAVAGFNEDELDVSLQNHVLRIEGKRTRDEANVDVQYLHRGIASRDFERTFPLNDNVEVRSVTVKNGIMTVFLEMIVPETEKAKKIAITFAK